MGLRQLSSYRLFGVSERMLGHWNRRREEVTVGSELAVTGARTGANDATVVRRKNNEFGCKLVLNEIRGMNKAENKVTGDLGCWKLQDLDSFSNCKSAFTFDI